MDSQYQDEYSNLNFPEEMTVKAWFDYWISMKKRTVRPNTVRNYAERYGRDIDPVIGKQILSEVRPIQCQMIRSRMADEGYRTSTIYQTRITLFNMLDYAYQNDVIMKNPCNGMVKSDIGKSTQKKETLALEQQRRFVRGIVGNAYERQYKFLLRTGLGTGELVGLKWTDIDFDNRTLKISRSMEYRHSIREWRIRELKSKSEYRSIPLTDETIDMLRKQKNLEVKVIPMEWLKCVFLRRKGTLVKNSTYDAMLFKQCDKIGIPRFSIHVLRRIFATRCIESGMKPKTLQTMLGHSNIGITMNLYVHTTGDEKHKEIAASLRVM